MTSNCTIATSIARHVIPTPRRRPFSTSQRSTAPAPSRKSKGAPALSLGDRPFRVGVIGGGPAGFYAAGRVLSTAGSANTKVDLFEFLPVPFGLARFGVAPDHPEVKNCEHKFEETARDPRFRFLGNVQVGNYVPSTSSSSSSTTTLVPNLAPTPHAAQISLSDLQPHYDAIILTYGASLDRSLDIPGEDLVNVLSARSFVNWYNGHPAHSSLLSPLIDLSKTTHVTIIGQGNVAIDVARLLLKPIDELAGTDLPEYALAELARSQVRTVSVVGRRGPLQLAATTKELREMMALPGVGFEMDPRLLESAKEDIEKYPNMEGARMRKRALGLLEGGSKTPLRDASKSWSLDFLQCPTRLLSSSSPPSLSPSSTSAIDSLLSTAPVTSIEFEHNELVPSRSGSDDPSTFQARGTGKTTTKRTDLVFKSVGYRSIGIPGVPFDERRGVIRNEGGRVVDDAGNMIPGLYTSGWLATGPTGVIAATMFNAFSTADTLASDLSSLSPSFSSSPKPEPDITKLAGGRKVVTWSDWERVDREERTRGGEKRKVREKMTDVKEILDFLQ